MVTSVQPVAKQVITILPDGRMAALQRKRGQGLDLRQFGPVEIERASLIVWNEEKQGWEIELQMQPFTGQKVSATHWAQGGYTVWPRDAHAQNESTQESTHDSFLFDDYDDAVSTEIQLLDGLRVRGLLGGKESGKMAVDRAFGTCTINGPLRELLG